MEEHVKALLLDLSGVLYDGDRPIPGATEAVEAARARGLTLRFVTNTATKSSRDILSKLHDMDIHVEMSELFTAPIAAHHYIRKHGLRPYCLVHKAIVDEFSDLRQDDPDCVLLGDARDGLNYASLNRAFQICQKGAPLIGIGMNRYFLEDGTLKLDAGAFIRALEWAADTEAVIMGKPSRAFFDEIVGSTGHDADHCLMIGDDVESDVLGAIEAGLRGGLVRTGKYQDGDEKRLPPGALFVDSIAGLFENPG